MKPEEAADFLFAMSNLAPINKVQHMTCEQAKAILDIALSRLAELAKEKKPKGGK